MLINLSAVIVDNGKYGKKMSFATNVNFIGYCKTRKNYENLKELKKDAKNIRRNTLNLINQLNRAI